MILATIDTKLIFGFVACPESSEVEEGNPVVGCVRWAVDLVDNSPDSVVSNVLQIFLLEDGVHLAASSHKHEHPDVSTWD